jgi:hypothetical protein
LFDGHYLLTAGLDIFDGPIVKLHGFLGVPTQARVHVVSLQIAEARIELPIAFSTQPVRPVLGRDALQFFVVTVRERLQEFYLSPEP